MALTYSILICLKSLWESGLVRETNSILELGEQNWFGDVDSRQISDFINLCEKNPQRKNKLENELAHVLETEPEEKLFDLAKIFYKAIFNFDVYRAVDFHGTSASEKHDLNYPVPITEQFDIVTNLGTAEHIFNVAQFFETVHEKTKKGGFMIHFFPNQGCYDHGFYNFHPTFVFDLARTNNYGIASLVYSNTRQSPPELLSILERPVYVQRAITGELSDYSHLFTVLVKMESRPFQFPQQGYYDSDLPDELRKAWNLLPR